MDFKVNSKVLEKLLTKVIPAVPTRTPMQILENFLFEINDGLLTVYATDLEIALKASITLVAEGNLKIVVPARLLYDIVRSLGDTQLIFKVADNGKINLQTSNGQYSLSYLQAEEFPDIPSFPQSAEGNENISEVLVDGKELLKALEQTAFAMSKEDMRPAMTGTLFEFSDEGLRFVCTDGHRLVNLLKKNIILSSNDQYIVPEKAISVLLKILEEKEVKILLSKTHISFRIGDLDFITRLIGQKYPDYNSVIPYGNEKFIKIQTDELKSAIKRMLLFSPTNSRKVRFTISQSNIEISAEDIDLGTSAKENILCDYQGEPLEIGFNSAYVNDVLAHLDAAEMIMKLQSPTKAVIIEPVIKKENEDLLLLLMPVRLNN